MRTPSVWRPTVLLLLGALGVAALGACGQKGALYLPADAPTTNEQDAKKKGETPPADARTPR